MCPKPRFFLDRGIGSRIVADGLRAEGWQLETMDERYGFEASMSSRDVDWIGEAAGRGEAILCKDRAIGVNPLEAQTVHMHDAKVFVIASAKIMGEQMLDRVLANADSIFRWADRTPGPFMCGIYENHLERLKLYYP